MKKELRFYEFVVLFTLGGLAYNLVEILFRGYSHWTMTLLGGVAFIFCGLINEVLSWDTPLYLQGIIASIGITILEFIAGYIINIKLGWNVWDYSNLPLNILGQVCLLFAFLWVFVGIGAIMLDDWLRYWLFKEEKPRYKIF